MKFYHGQTVTPDDIYANNDYWQIDSRNDFLGITYYTSKDNLFWCAIWDKDDGTTKSVTIEFNY